MAGKYGEPFYLAHDNNCLGYDIIQSDDGFPVGDKERLQRLVDCANLFIDIPDPEAFVKRAKEDRRKAQALDVLLLLADTHRVVLSNAGMQRVVDLRNIDEMLNKARELGLEVKDE